MSDFAVRIAVSPYVSMLYVFTRKCLVVLKTNDLRTKSNKLLERVSRVSAEPLDEALEVDGVING